MKRYLLNNIFVCSFYLLLSVTVAAQETCATFIQNALTTAMENCTSLVPDTLCYGHATVNAEFRSSVDFATSGATTSLADLTSIQLSGFDETRSEWGVMYARINTLQQSVSLLAFGNVSIQNDSILPIVTATIAASATVNLRSGPGTSFAIVASLEPDTSVILNGRNEAGDWLRVQLPDQTTDVWIAAFLVEADTAFDSLTVVQLGDVVYAAMQKFHLQTGTSDTDCAELPMSGVLLQTATQEITSEIIINDVHIFLNGTVFIESDEQVIIHVLEGQTNIQALNSSMPVPTGGEATAFVGRETAEITLTPYNRNDLQLLPLTLLPRPVELEQPLTADTVIEILEDQRRCRVFASDTVNVRSGPGTIYPTETSLEVNIRYYVEAQAHGLDSQTWWLLDNDSWVRADIVNVEGDCQQLSTITDLPPTPTPQPTQATVTRYQSFDLPGCQHYGYDEVRSGDVITFMLGPNLHTQTREELEVALSSSTGTLTVNDVPQPAAQPVGISHERDGFQALQRFVWTATPGTHTIVGGWTGYWQASCVVIVIE